MANQILAAHRQQFPDDGRSDLDILTQYASQDPAAFSQFPDAVRDYKILSGQTQQSIEPEGAFTTAAREFGEEIGPAVVGAAGALGAGALASETGPGAIAAAVAGGTAAQAAGTKARDLAEQTLLGEEGFAQLRAQEETNRQAHPIAAKVGAFLGQAPSMLSGRGLAKIVGFGREAAEAATAKALSEGVEEVAAKKLGEAARAKAIEQSMAAHLLENAAAGATMSGGSAAAAKITNQPGSEDISIPGEMVKGAVTMGVVGFIPQAKSVLGAIGWKAPTDAAALGVANALYDHFVRGQDIDPKALAENIGTDIPGFMLMNGLTAYFHMPFFPTKNGEITSAAKGTKVDPTEPKTEPQPANPAQPAIDPAAVYHLSDDQKSILSGLAARVADGDAGPDVQAAVLKNTSQWTGATDSLRAEAEVFFKNDVERIKAERAAQQTQEQMAAAARAQAERQAQHPEPNPSELEYGEGGEMPQTQTWPVPPEPSPKEPVLPTSEPPPSNENEQAKNENGQGTPQAPADAPSPQPEPAAVNASSSVPSTQPGDGAGLGGSGGGQHGDERGNDHGPVEDLLNRVGFGAAQLVGQGPAAVGKQQAEAYVQTSHPAELFKDATATTGNKTKSRKLAVLVDGDGNALIATAYQQRRQMKVKGAKATDSPKYKAVGYVSQPNGKGVQLDELIAEHGYKLVAALKTTDPTEGYAVKFDAHTWESVRDILNDWKQKAKADYSTMQEQIEANREFAEKNKDTGAKMGNREDEKNDLATEEEQHASASEEAAQAHTVAQPELKGFTPEHAEAMWDAVSRVPVGGLDDPNNFKKAFGNPRAYAAMRALMLAVGRTGPADTPPEEILRAAKKLIYDSQRSTTTGKDGFIKSILAGKGEKASEPARRVGEGNEPADRLAENRNTGRAEAAPGVAGGGAGQEEVSDTRAQVEAAAAQADPNPSREQIDANNYRKGHVNIDGLDITIETAKGEIRKDKETGGNKWQVEMPAHYGEVRGTEGNDGDPVDVYIGDNPDSDKVWVVDQINPRTRRFDEHKGLIGFNSREEAIAAYDTGFSDGSGPSRRGAVTEMSKEEFSDWVNEGGGAEGALAYGKPKREAAIRFSIRKKKGGRKAKAAPIEDEDLEAQLMEEMGGAAPFEPVEGPGWLSKDSKFIPAEDDMQIAGYMVGGHEATLLKWLEKNDPKALDSLYAEAEKAGVEDFDNPDSMGFVREWALRNGFVRIRGDRTRMYLEGTPSHSQLKLLTDSAVINETELIHDMGNRHSRTLFMPGIEEMMSKRRQEMREHLTNDADTAARFNASLDTLKAQGVNTSMVEGLERGGIWSSRMIRMVVSSLTSPSKDDLTMLWHEAGHELFSRLHLPLKAEEAFHRAIQLLARPEDQIVAVDKGAVGRALATGGKEAARQLVQGIRGEEVLVERVGRSLVEQGFNPAMADTISKQLMRYAKRIYYRVNMAIQSGLLGKVSSDLAERYFQTRMESFLAGDSPMNFLSFMGGPKLTVPQIADTFRRSEGLASAFNYDAGGTEFREALPETMAAMQFNSAIAKLSVRPGDAGTAHAGTRDPHIISSDLNSPEKVSEDIAAYNALHEVHTLAHRVLSRIVPGLPFDQFIRDFTNSDGPATDKIQARNSELVANGHPAADPTVLPADLKSEASQMQAADKALHYLWSLREHWSDRAKEAQRFVKNAGVKLARLNTRLYDLTKRYTDMDFQVANGREELKDLFDDFTGDLIGGRVETSARRAGILSQTIAQIDQRISDPLVAARQYEPVINRLYARLTGDRSGSFIEMMRRVAEMDIDWDNIKTKDAADLIAKMVAPGDPFLQQLESRGLASIAVAFAKSNSHVMEFLKLSRDQAIEDRAKLNEILKGALDRNTDAIPRARELAKKLPRLSVTADRLLTKLERLQGETHAHIDEMQRAETFLEFHHEAMPMLRTQMVNYERMIGARLQSWEATNGAEYFVAPKPGAQDEAVMASKRTLQLAGVEGNEQITNDIRANKAWLKSIPEAQQGALWNTVNEMTTKLEETVALAGHELVIKQSGVNRLLGSIVDKLESTGLPTGRTAAKRMRLYLAEKQAAHEAFDNAGLRWKAAEGRAMKALGVTSLGAEKFQRMFLQAALSFAEKRSDIRTQYRTDAEAFEHLLPEIKRHLEGDHDTAQMLTRPGAWGALEKYYRETYSNMDLLNALRKKLGIKIREVGPDGFSIEREPIGSTFFTSLRRVNRNAVRMYHGMRDAGWLGTDADPRLKAGDIEAQYYKDPNSLMARLARRFTPDVWRDFVKPLANMEGRAPFHGPMQVDGLDRIALNNNVREAFKQSGGNAIQFAETLFNLESNGKHIIETQGHFIGRTMEAFQEFFDSVHNTQKDNDDSVRRGIPTPPRLLQDARVSESWPGEWLEYHTYGRYEMHEMSNMLAAQGAFGRNMDAMRSDLQTTVGELSRKALDFDGIVRQVMADNPGKRGRSLQDAIRREVEKRGANYTDLSQSTRNLSMVRNEQSQFEALMKMQGGLAMELRPFLEAVGAMVGATVQGPGTALVHFGNMGQQFLKFGMGPVAMRVLKRSGSTMGSENLGTFAQLLHLTIGWNAERNARRVRLDLVDPDSRRKFADTIVGMMNDQVASNNPVAKALFKVSRAARAAVSSGIGTAPEDAKNAYVTLKPHALFTQLAQHMDAAFIDGWVGAFEDMVERAHEFVMDPANAGKVTDPAFKFDKFTDLGYSKGFLGLGSDERAFEFMRTSMARYGISLEQAAMDLAARRAADPKAPALTDKQFRTLASIVQNEVTLSSNPATRPSNFFTNPVLKAAAPLLGWSVSKTHDNWESFRRADMTQQATMMKALGAGLLPYLALVPMGMALGMLRNQFASTVLNKKANREDPTSFAGMVDSLAWVGTLGLAGDVYNSWLNRDTQRPFDVDHRVFLVSTLLGVKSALQNWYEQGSADYNTVYRPLLQALGGSGYLQYAQIMNNAMSLDNQEARVTARINAANILRVAGREMGMDVRVSGGGETMSNPMRPLIGRMVLAAYGNDPVDFREAYREALQQAREQGEPNPEQYVAQKYGFYNPLKSVFRTEPSELELSRMLGTLNDSDRASVTGALRLFNAYGDQLGVKADFGKAQRSARTVSLQEARRRMAG